MYCPNCSTEASTEQKFCRSCGMELQAVADLIRDQSPMVKPKSHQKPTFEARQRAMLIWGFIITFGAAAVGASLKILAKESIHPAGEFTPYVSVLAVVAAIFGMGLMCYPFLQMMSDNARSRRPPLPKPQPTIKLRSVLLPEEQPSVTDQTTEFLEEIEARINVRDTAPQNE
jgi:hypothetical protein